MNPSFGEDTAEGRGPEARESASGAAPNAKLAPGRLERAIAGVQAGAFAALMSMGWWMLAGLPNNQSIWTLSNLMGGVFYGQRSLRAGIGPFTAAGFALHILLCVALAVLFSQLLPPGARLLTALVTGTLAASLWFYLWDGFFWRVAFPPFALYAKQGSIFFGYLLQGLCVGLYSLFVCSARVPKISN